MVFVIIRRCTTAVLKVTGALLVAPVIAVAGAGEPAKYSPTTTGTRTFANDEGLPERQRAAIDRALPQIARQTQSWIDQKKCTSCHQVPHALWAMNEARAAGFAADDRLAEWNRWAADFVLRKIEKKFDGDVEAARDGVDETLQILLFGIHRKADRSKSAVNPASIDDQLRLSLHNGRADDQLWHAGGQLPDQKRPLQETNEVTTMWTLLALRSLADHSKTTKREVLTSPAIANNSVSIEHLSLRYMLALAEGASARADLLRTEILAHQNTDGGWGWLLDGRSDALATGQALYALSKAVPKDRRDAATRARSYLIDTQRPDGSWQVPSTLAAKKEQAYVVSNDWGTSWAVIGLLSTMEHEEPAGRQRKPH